MSVLMIIGAAILVFGAIISVITIRRQQEHQQELDKGASSTTVKHPWVANPIFIVYLLFPVVVIVGAIIWAYLK